MVSDNGDLVISSRVFIPEKQKIFELMKKDDKRYTVFEKNDSDNGL